jgi:putative component of membrane protein insertase Oxa1/YidC/SpoIIIJ protein YidD
LFKNKNAFVKYNPISLLFGGGLYFYQKVISSQIQAGCAFDVSCSNFSKQSISKFGLLKGIALSTDRLTRCTRVSAVDFHPVMMNSDGKCIDHPDFYIFSK